jgi:hypothetical protein
VVVVYNLGIRGMRVFPGDEEGIKNDEILGSRLWNKNAL